MRCECLVLWVSANDLLADASFCASGGKSKTYGNRCDAGTRCDVLRRISIVFFYVPARQTLGLDCKID
jgi:hypothetical protein